MPGGPQVTRLADHAAVLAATGWDHYARTTVRPDRMGSVGWALRSGVVWVGLDAEERIPYICALGPARDVAELVARTRDEWPREAPLTVPATAAAALGAGFDARMHWRFRTADRSPGGADDPRVRVLGEADLPAVAELLDESSGLVSAEPGDEAVRRWVGLEEGGRLLTCAADTSGSPGIGHLGSVATRPDARGRGLAGAVVAWLTRDLLRAGAEVVAVGVFVDEPAAQRLYDRAGFRTEHEFCSGRLLA